MDEGVCRNFETVQDSLVFWPPSYWLCGLCLFGAVIISKKALYAGGPLKVWLKPSILFLLFLCFFHLIQSDRAQKMENFKSGKKIEIIGKVSNIETEYTRSTSFIEAPNSVSFMVDKKRLKFDMSMIPLKSGNRCNWNHCGLSEGDVVRVVSYGGGTTKIERCTDNDG